MTCPKCGGQLTSKISGSSQTVICTQCGWSVATTYIEPIRADQTVYSLVLDMGNTIDKVTLSAVSRVAGCNYLRAKKMVEASPVIVAKGPALEIQHRARILADAGVSYSISPDFPYDI